MEEGHIQKYCPKCQTKFDDINPKYKFCPNCGGILTFRENTEIFRYLNEICKKDIKRNLCSSCGKEFDLTYEFCPLCSNKLSLQNVFSIDYLREQVVGKWNKGFEKFTFDEIEHDLLINANPMPIMFDEVFESKLKFDELLERDIITFEQAIDYKLSYKELYSILSLLRFVKDDEYHFLFFRNCEYRRKFGDIIGQSGLNYFKVSNNLFLMHNTIGELKSFLKEYPFIDRWDINREKVLEIVVELLELKDYFENPPEGSYTEDDMGYCNCKQTDKILKLLYDNEIDDIFFHERLEYMEGKYNKNTPEEFSREKLSFKEVFAVLTWLTRSERGGGAFFKAIEDKTFYNLISRLEEIREEI